MTEREEFDAILMKMKTYFVERAMKTERHCFEMLLDKEGRIQELERIVYFAQLRNVDPGAADIVDALLEEIGEAPAHGTDAETRRQIREGISGAVPKLTGKIRKAGWPAGWC